MRNLQVCNLHHVSKHNDTIRLYDIGAHPLRIRRGGRVPGPEPQKDPPPPLPPPPSRWPEITSYRLGQPGAGGVDNAKARGPELTTHARNVNTLPWNEEGAYTKTELRSYRHSKIETLRLHAYRRRIRKNHSVSTSEDSRYLDRLGKTGLKEEWQCLKTEKETTQQTQNKETKRQSWQTTKQSYKATKKQTTKANK